MTSSEGSRILRGDNILVAVGTKPARPSHIPFDGTRIFDSDELLKLEQIPRSMIVVGAGVIGIEYAIMLATLGVQVTVVDGRERILDFCDSEIVDTLIYHARSLGIVFRLGEDVVGIQKLPQGMVFVQLESGKRLVGETVLFTVGRVGDTADLNLQAAGLEPDERGRLWCNEHNQTWVPHIYGVGDVVGFPALASVSMEQGRRAVCHAFGQPFETCKHLPYGLFSIPEISMVGQTEQKLTADCVPYEVGVARYKEIARGHIIGDTTGMLKILFHRHTRKLLGIHCIGEAATEIVHIGQAVMALDGTMDYFRDTVFNYPTMAECYKDGRLRRLQQAELRPLVHAGRHDSKRRSGRDARGGRGDIRRQRHTVDESPQIRGQRRLECDAATQDGVIELEAMGVQSMTARGFVGFDVVGGVAVRARGLAGFWAGSVLLGAAGAKGFVLGLAELDRAEGAVEFIADDRVAEFCHMQADLMVAAGARAGVDERVLGAAGKHFVIGAARPAIAGLGAAGHEHAPRFGRRADGDVDRAAILGQNSLDECQVAF